MSSLLPSFVGCADIEWPDPGDISNEAVDLIEKLLQIKASERLGYHGASEVKVRPPLQLRSIHFGEASEACN